MINYFQYEHTFKLESQQELEGLQIAYSVYGNPSATKVIWVCHALSGNSEVQNWWSGLFGEKSIFDKDEYKIICANVIGSCYGSTGPSTCSIPLNFPLITVKDMVKAHVLLADFLNLQKIDILIGASLGGQQALEWAVTENERFEKLILVATNAVHSSYGKALNETQRLALESDQSFGKIKGGQNGLKAARGIAMVSYRSYQDFERKQVDFKSGIENYRASSYIQYQGDKFKNRFDAVSYYRLTQAMDSHDVARGRKDGIAQVLNTVSAKTLVVGVDSDALFPIEEQEFLAKNIWCSELAIIKSEHGHDAFLIEYHQLNKFINDFVHNDFKSFKPTQLKKTKSIK